MSLPPVTAEVLTTEIRPEIVIGKRFTAPISAFPAVPVDVHVIGSVTVPLVSIVPVSVILYTALSDATSVFISTFVPDAPVMVTYHAAASACLR